MDSTETRGHDLAETCRAMVRAEGESMHRRMTWLATLQGFLFAGAGLAWNSPESGLVVSVIAFLGLTVAILVFLSFIGPNSAVLRIRAYWLSRKPEGYDGPDIFGWFPEKWPWSIWITPETLMPVAFALAWFALLLFRK